MFESFDSPFYWSAPFCVLTLPKLLVCRIVWCVGCVSCTSIVATAPADTVAHCWLKLSSFKSGSFC